MANIDISEVLKNEIMQDMRKERQEETPINQPPTNDILGEILDLPEEERTELLETIRKKKSKPNPYNVDKSGKFTLENFKAYLKVKGIQVKYDVILHRQTITGFGDKVSKDHITETAPTYLYDELQKYFKNCHRNTITNYLIAVATENRFNSVLDMINEKPWDGSDQLQILLDILQIDNDDIISKELIELWLKQCYCLLFNTLDNPFSGEFVLVFKGIQGAGKTSLFRKLALEEKYFGEGVTLDPSNKDNVIQVCSKWITELGELDSTMKKDVSKTRAFITLQSDEYRAPYGASYLRYPRITSFAGTVNEDKFLVDTTGNRRFAVIQLKDSVNIRKNLYKLDALQLWRQIKAKVDTEILHGKTYSDCFRIDKDLLAIMNANNQQFMKLLPAEQEVSDILEELNYLKNEQHNDFTVTDEPITATAFKERHSALKAYKSTQIATVLEKLGYKRNDNAIKTPDGTRRRTYMLPVKKYETDSVI